MRFRRRCAVIAVNAASRRRPSLHVFGLTSTPGAAPRRGCAAPSSTVWSLLAHRRENRPAGRLPSKENHMNPITPDPDAIDPEFPPQAQATPDPMADDDQETLETDDDDDDEFDSDDDDSDEDADDDVDVDDATEKE